jgi:hypothetical protein
MQFSSYLCFLPFGSKCSPQHSQSIFFSQKPCA